MKLSIEQEIKSLSQHFTDWDSIMHKYNIQRYERIQRNENDDKEITDKHAQTSSEVNNIFETILRLYTTHGNFKDNWNFPLEYRVFPFGQEVFVQSQKMEVTFNFGLHHDDFILYCYLRHPYYLKNMNDGFWSHFIELQSLGEFHFLENAIPSSQEARKFMNELKNTKSNIFQIIRNYILLEIYNGGSVDLGELQMKWPITTSWDKIIKSGAEAFTKFYKINYKLYHANYLYYKRKS